MLTNAANTFPPFRLAVSDKYRPSKNGTYSTAEEVSMVSAAGVKPSGIRNVNCDEVPTLITKHNIQPQMTFITKVIFHMLGLSGYGQRRNSHPGAPRVQTDNHSSTSPLSFLQAGCPFCHPTNSIKALKAHLTYNIHSKFTMQQAGQTGNVRHLCLYFGQKCQNWYRLIFHFTIMQTEGTVRHRHSKEASILWSHHEEMSELSG